MSKNSFPGRIEPLIIFAILYFPVFLSNQHNTLIYNNCTLIFYYLFISLFQILFLLYFIKLKKTEDIYSGLKIFKFSSFSISILYASVLLILVISVNYILDIFIKAEVKNSSFEKTFFFILQALIISLFTGYREELFFRSYFISASEKYYGKMISAAAGSVLFSLSHVSGGLHAVILSLAAGFFLSYIFLKHRNLHINALTHAIYNFLILVSAFQ